MGVVSDFMRPGCRKWAVELEIGDRGWINAQVSADGRVLLPTCRERTAEQALQYVEGALVDMQAGDSVEPSVLSPIAARRCFRATSRSVAMVWLAETLLSAARAARLELGAPGSEPPMQTGTRLKIQKRAPDSDKEHTG
jgi:hypothetical protein